MKNIIVFFILFLGISMLTKGQEITLDDLLADFEEDTEASVFLPEKMLFTQRMLWGEKGLYRGIGIAPKIITAETREKELKARKKMFKIHQVTGLLTAGGMIAQAIIGPKLYNGNYAIKNAHEKVALGTNILYGTTAIMAFTSPPPMINRKKFDNIKLHKLLSIVHLSGMITTNVLAQKAANGQVDKKWHRAAAITTFGAYAAAIASIKFEF
jgi:uncharacterized membrane protein